MIISAAIFYQQFSLYYLDGSAPTFQLSGSFGLVFLC